MYIGLSNQYHKKKNYIIKLNRNRNQIIHNIKMLNICTYVCIHEL